MAMKLKMDDAGHAVVVEGKPVYVHDDGKEAPFDADATVGSLHRTLEESRKYKERAQTAEAGLKNFEGIENPEDARKALDTVKNLSAGDLVKADKVEEIKREARLAAEQQVANAAKASSEEIKKISGEREMLQNQLYSEKVGGAFSRSKFIGEKLAVPTDLIQAAFGQRFKVEEGRIVGYDPSGNKLYSRTKPGELAEFDEALESMVDSYAHRDSILKGTNQSGSGAKPSNGQGGKRTITRAQFEATPQLQRNAIIAEGIVLVD